MAGCSAAGVQGPTNNGPCAKPVQP